MKENKSKRKRKRKKKEQNNQKMVIKMRKLENDRSEESDIEDSESDTENHKSSAVKEFLRKIKQMNSYLFMNHDVLHHMMNEMKQETSFLRHIRDGRVTAQSSTSASASHWTESRRRSRSRSLRRKTPTRRRIPPMNRPLSFRRK